MTTVNSLHQQQRKDAMRALLNIVIVEGVVLMAVVGVFLYTGEVFHLLGGVVGTSLIFGPMFLRWYNEHGKAWKRNEDEGRHD
ncbi:MAG: hypothetical protein JKX88_02300 [Marinicaulis sp.]|nr:hypothetical protein [Marinicaulis sp.]